jgi:hypothetical protein
MLMVSPASELHIDFVLSVQEAWILPKHGR